MSPSTRRGSIPIAAVPVPNPPLEQRERRKSRVLQSSLDLVFSYSRSQQLRYGPRGAASSGSAPSFVDGYPSSRSHSHSSPEGQLDEDEEGEYAYEQSHRDVRKRWQDLEAAAGSSSSPHAQPASLGHDQEPRHYSAGEDGIFFPSDPVSPTSQTLYTAAGPASHISATGADPPASSSAAIIDRPIVNNYFTPLSSRQASSINASLLSGLTSKRAPQHRRRSGASIGKAEAKASISASHSPERTPLLSRDTAQRYNAVTDDGHLLDVPRGRRTSTGQRRKSEAEILRMGHSTDGQTLFNATAVLVGIGLLSLPLAFAYAGWIGGTVMLVSFGWLTCYTAKLLARLIRADTTMLGYTDIGQRAFGSWAGGLINVLFCLELFALGVALIVLFGDTLNIIYPGISSNAWKMIGFAIILPTALMPLHLLSLPSLLSSLSSLLLIIVLLIDGLIKPTSPGSLRDPMPTSWIPEWEGYNWLGGIGLVLAGFGGHAVMPSLARDMKRPENFDRIVNKAFAIATGISFVAGAAGYLMIGQTVSDEITRDLMVKKYHYPRALNLVALWMIVVNPLSKFGLSSRPLNVTIETLLGIAQDPSIKPLPIPSEADPSESDLSAKSSSLPQTGRRRPSFTNATAQRKSPPRLSSASRDARKKTFFRVISRTVVTALCTTTAIALPGFGRVMAFLGSFSAFLICIILPLLFYLRLEPRLISSSPSSHSTDQNGGKTGRRLKVERTVHWILVGVSTILMIAGTVWAFVPGSGHGGLEE